MKKVEVKSLFAHIYLKNGKAVHGLDDFRSFEDGDPIALSVQYEMNGADSLIIFDLSDTVEDSRANRELISKIHARTSIPIISGGHINDFEDIRAHLDAGADTVFLNMAKEESTVLLELASRKFGREHLAVCIDDYAFEDTSRLQLEEFASIAILLGDPFHQYDAVHRLSMYCIPIIEKSEFDRKCVLLRQDNVLGISGNVVTNPNINLISLKEKFYEHGIPMKYQTPSVPWSEMKLNSDGLVPVIVQDYRNNDVLMMAYMNEEAYNTTIRTGRMTYWSRSRQSLWVKGETSGHYQYVKKMAIDCDNDTILAKVSQVGAACHTGNRSCFYRDLIVKDSNYRDPMASFQILYKNALKRKESMTKEMMAKDAVDIMKHVMTLMAEYDVTWDEVSEALSLTGGAAEKE